ncbi:gliding motility-associated C-terminal domain-containing protein [Flavobacterium sp. LB3P21]|uniref:T9SS type B sorting domain-containing protein n=1 Tax=Flavobacterium sp. LB3P21 TaxID=3401719 RepID=UPI003AB0BE85
MKNNYSKTLANFSAKSIVLKKQLQKKHLIIVLFFLSFLCSFSAIAQCNTDNPIPFIEGTFGNLTAQGTVSGGLGCLLCSATNTPRLIDADLTNFATASIPLGVAGSVNFKVTDGDTDYAAGTFVGYRIAPSGGLLSLELLNIISIKTYLNGSGTAQETFTGNSLLSQSLVSSPGNYVVGFNSTVPFDAIEISIGSLVGLLNVVNVYYPVIRNYCAGPALDCNVSTAMNLPIFPVSIENIHTGLSGVSVGSISNAENVTSSNTTDFATINLTVGLLASGSIAVKDQLTDYPSGTYAGFEIENSNLVSVSALGNLQIRTYLNGILSQDFSGNNLLVNGVLLSATGRYKVGFVSSSSFDEVRITVNQTVGINLGSTKVFNAVFEKFCAGPSLPCNTQTAITAPAYPVFVNGAKTGIDGVVCALCSVTGQDNLIDVNTTNYAEINLTTSVGTTGSISIKNQITDYPAGTFAGYDIENPSLLNVNVFDAISITTYLNGIQQETKSGNAALISVGTNLLVGTGRQTIGFVSTLAFDEVRITLTNLVSVSLGITRVYAAVFQKYCAATVACNQSYAWTNPDFPVVVDGDNTGIDGVACVACSVNNTNNVLTSDTTDFAKIDVIAGVIGSGSIAVVDQLFTYPAGTFAGFVIKDLNTLIQLNLFQSLTVSTYNNGVLQESKSGGLLIDLTLLSSPILGSGPGYYNVGFNVSLPFDEIKFSVASLAGVINSIEVYGAFVDTKDSNGGSLLCVSDLAVTTTVNNSTPNVGSNVTFTITVSNNGPSDATGVSVSDVLPSGYTFVSASPSTGTWTAPTWTIGTLANGSTVTLDIVATVNATGVYANTATILGAETDPIPGNNSSTITPVPVAQTDVTVTTTVNNSTPNVGSNVTFTITASNNGPSDATGVSVSNVLPSGYTFVSASPSTGTWTAPTWTIGTLANGSTVTLDIVATVNATGVYANTATISGAETDPSSGNNSSTITPVPVAQTDLAVTTTVNNSTPNVGSNVTFTITASNNGPSDATGVSVSNVLPSGYTFVSASPSTGTWTAPTWTIGTLANGSTVTLDIVATVNATGVYANTATISGAETDPSSGNNSSTITPVPVAQTDLTVTTTVNNSTPNVGSNVIFTITVSNNGPSDATGVSVSNVLPSGYTFVSASPSTGTWTAPTWTIGTLANGSTVTLDIVATVNATGVYANTATISGAETDPSSGNNSSTITPVPVAQTDLTVTTTVNNSTPNVGSNVIFTITVSNNGPSDATGVSVSDVLPSGYTFVSASPSTGTWTAPTWTIGTLANGGTVTLDIVATVNATGVYANTATILGAETDPIPGNNSSTITPVPVAQTDLAVTTTVNNSTPNVGSNVTFTITVSNNGPSDATGVSVSNVLPSGYTFVSASPSTGTWTAPTWTIGTLANGGTVTLDIVATVNATGVYANTATISGGQTDPISGNNNATITPVAIQLVQTDLTVTKMVNNSIPTVGSNVTFTITASNNGPSDATGVSVSEVLPSGYTFVSASPSTGTWTAPTWTIGTLANGGTATLNIVATVNATGEYANTATISGGQTDPTPRNNSSTITPTPLQQNPAIALIKTAVFEDDNNDGFAQVGENVNYAFTVMNMGNVTLRNVRITDLLPGIVITGGPISLSVGESNSTAFVGVYRLTQQDITAGSVANQATAYGTSPLGVIVTDISDNDSSLESDPTVIAVTGCVLKVFNAVSPNGDGLNDVFYIGGIECYPNNTVVIYNRWGVKVFDAQGYDNINRVFRGISEGRDTISQPEGLPAGTYFYSIRYTDLNGNGIDKSGYLHIAKD